MDESKIMEVAQRAIAYDRDDTRRIMHFLTVWNIARMIASGEKADDDTKAVVELTAILHDIGIRNSLIKYNDALSIHQEQEGPAVANLILTEAKILDTKIVERVKFIIGHHHTYSACDAQDFQMVVEADLIANSYEDDLRPATRNRIYDEFIRTETGKKLYKGIFPLESADDRLY